jgi:hypothetical protein
MLDLQHPQLRAIELELSSFVVEGCPDLNMIIYNPIDEKQNNVFGH